jgi:hypothetical protein
MRVKVTQCSDDVYWYIGHVSETFEVEECSLVYWVTGEDKRKLMDTGKYIGKREFGISKYDCEIIGGEETMKIKITSAPSDVAYSVGEVYEVKGNNPYQWEVDVPYFVDHRHAEVIKEPIDPQLYIVYDETDGCYINAAETKESWLSHLPSSPLDHQFSLIAIGPKYPVIRKTALTLGDPQ